MHTVQEQRKEHSSQWAIVQSIASKIGCTSETLRRWIQQAERDQGKCAGMTTDEKDRLKQLERENRELKCANEILRKASAYAGTGTMGLVHQSDRGSQHQTVCFFTLQT